MAIIETDIEEIKDKYLPFLRACLTGKDKIEIAFNTGNSGKTVYNYLNGDCSALQTLKEIVEYGIRILERNNITIENYKQTPSI